MTRKLQVLTASERSKPEKEEIKDDSGFQEPCVTVALQIDANRSFQVDVSVHAPRLSQQISLLHICFSPPPPPNLQFLNSTFGSAETYFTSWRETNLVAPRFHRKQTGAGEGTRCCFAIL